MALEPAWYSTIFGVVIFGGSAVAILAFTTVVAISLHTRGQPCTTNPLGVKGCGEAGAIAGFPAIANAISDAFGPGAFVNLHGPASPGTLWKHLRPDG